MPGLSKSVVLALSIVCVAPFAATTVAPAAAAPATPEEAKRLTSLFETYLGAPAPGAVSSVAVTPVDDGYKVAIDLGRLAAPLVKYGTTVVATTPYTLMLTPRPDGTWTVVQQAFPQIGVSSAKGATYSFQQLDSAMTGVFDPKIKSFSSYRTANGGTKSSANDAQRSQQTQIIEERTQMGTAKGDDANHVDGTTHLEEKDVTYALTSTPRNADASSADVLANLGSGTIAVKAKIASAVSHASLDNQRVGALLDLWAFVVAHPSRDALVAEQARLKSLALAMLPLTSHTDLMSRVEDMTVGFKGGVMSATSFEQKFSIADSIAYGLKIDGLKIEAAAMPAWTLGLVPARVDLALTTSVLHVSDALTEVVKAADLSKDDPLPKTTVDVAADALLKGTRPALHLAPGVLANDTLTVAFAGDVFATRPQPSGSLKVKAKGLSDEIAKLRAANVPLAAQTAQQLTVLSLLAQNEPDGSLTWDIEGASSGEVTLNGKRLR